MKHRLFWPVAALVSLIVINTVARSQFASITVRDGRFYGALIDILRQSAPLMLVSLGMTIVIATRGIDLSVGAVMAVSGAVALTIIDGSADPNDLGVVTLAVVVAILVSLLLGAWNGFLVSLLGIQPIIATLVLMLAGRGVALLITEGFITTVNSTPFEFISTGYLLLLPFAFFIWVAAVAAVGVDRTTHCTRRPHGGRWDQPRGEPSRRGALDGIIWSAYAASAVLAGIAGIIYASNIKAADANAAGQFIELYAILAVVLGGTSLMGGKFTLAGTVVGVLIIQTLESTMLFLGVPPAESPVFFAVVVVVVVVIQSPRLHRFVRDVVRSVRSRGMAESSEDAGVAI